MQRIADSHENPGRGSWPGTSPQPALTVLLALSIGGPAHGQEAAVATKSPAPVSMTVCESGNRCSTWTFRGKMGSGVGPNGEMQVLALERADDKALTVHRTDMSGASAGLTAEYRGSVVKDRIEGTVVSQWPGHWDAKTDQWTATTNGTAAGPASAPTGSDGKLVGKWGPLVISFDDGKTVHGAVYDAHGYNHVYEGTYVAPDQIEVAVTRIDPQGCKTIGYGHWHPVGDDKMETRFDGWNGCGVQTGQERVVVAKAVGPSPSMQQAGGFDPVSTMMMMGILGAMMSGGDDACRGRGCD